jgi:uncharacterized protein YndB with AHSA1/START domain
MAEIEAGAGSAKAETGVSVVIERPPEQVFAALTNVAGHTEWAKGPEEITNISENPAHLGTTWEQVGKLLGKKIVTKLQVNTYEENRKFGYGSDKPFPMQFLFTLKPVTEGTELRMFASGEPANIFGKVALPILVKSVERQMESDLYSLKGILEDGA